MALTLISIRKLKASLHNEKPVAIRKSPRSAKSNPLSPERLARNTKPAPGAKPSRAKNKVTYPSGHLTRYTRSQHSRTQRSKVPTDVDSSDDYRAPNPQASTSSVCPVCHQHLSSTSATRHAERHKRALNERDNTSWRCKGVRVRNAAAYRVPESSPVYTYNNVVRTGGCLRLFSRRDTLNRHLSTATACFGSASRESSLEV